MSLRLPAVDRRTLLIGGGVGVGLIVGIAAWPRRAGEDGEAQRLGAFVRIGRDGRVTVAVPQTESGQGVWTALPQILADELGAAWDQVAVEPAPLGSDAYGNGVAAGQGWLDGLGAWRRWRVQPLRITAGSTSVRAFEQPLREAGAAARAMLIAAAAARWGVDAGECDAAEGMVHHAGKALGFGALAEAAAGQRAPSSPQLRRGRLAGRPLPRLDLPSKSDGSFRFAADVRLPEMLFASARLAPPGGRLSAFSRRAIEAAPGVRGLVTREGWIAVAADNWWSAEQALVAARPHFAGAASPDAGELRALAEAALAGGGGETLLERGDYARAVAGSRPLAATYWVAPAMHLGLEPVTATARFSGERLEVWAATLAPDLAREAAARAASLRNVDVMLYPMPAGEPGGRALEPDAIPLAVEMARELRRPVQLALSPRASQNHGPVEPPLLATMNALPGAGGITTALRMRLAGAGGIGAALARLAGGEASGGPGLGEMILPYAIPDLAIESVPLQLPFRTGYVRGAPERALAFAAESFVDELARAAGLEPLAFRMAMLGGSPRLAHCLQAAAAAAGWDGGRRGRSTMGLAAVSAYGSHIALVADASIAPDQKVQVHRLVAAVDCGRVVNPQLVRQQVEGGLIWALGQATVRAPQWAAGMPRSRDQAALELPRIGDTPDIRVQIMPSSAAPGGVSALAVPPLAPAIANAIFAATGKRLRNLPFDPTSA